MNAREAIANARKLVEHLKGLDSGSDDWKCIHALLVIAEANQHKIEILEQLVHRIKECEEVLTTYMQARILAALRGAA